MILSLFIFILFFLFLLGMVFSKKTIYAVYFLIGIFILYSVFLFSLNIEFLGVIYIMLYLGAIMVLYLFVVMFIGTKLIEDFGPSKKAFPIKFFFFILLCILFFIYFFFDFNLSFFDEVVFFFSPDYLNTVFFFDNFNIFAFLLYDVYPLHLVMASLILLLAMICAIILSLSYLLSY